MCTRGLKYMGSKSIVDRTVQERANLLYHKDAENACAILINKIINKRLAYVFD